MKIFLMRSCTTQPTNQISMQMQTVEFLTNKQWVSESLSPCVVHTDHRCVFMNVCVQLSGLTSARGEIWTNQLNTVWVTRTIFFFTLNCGKGYHKRIYIEHSRYEGIKNIDLNQLGENARLNRSFLKLSFTIKSKRGLTAWKRNRETHDRFFSVLFFCFSLFFRG